VTATSGEAGGGPSVGVDRAARAARAAARLAKQVEVALGEMDLSLPQYRVLALLSRGSAAASVLAGNLSVSRPSVTALVDGLIARGLVQRGDDPDDRRKVTHLLTSKGKRTLRQADAVIATRLEEIAAEGGDASGCFDGLLAWADALDTWRDRRVLTAQR